MTKQEAINKLLDTARAEIGYLEKASNANLDNKTGNAGSKNYNKYAAMLDKTDTYNGPKNGADWCDVFADAMFVTAFGVELAQKAIYQPKKGCGAGCSFSRGYYQAAGKLYSTPEPGDQCFFYNTAKSAIQHTGIVEKVENGTVYTIEGNTTAQNGNQQGVWRKSYPLNYARWAGFGRPDWDLICKTLTQATPTPAKKDGSDWSKTAREWAIANKIVAGNGNGTYGWSDPITKEQVISILHNFAVNYLKQA